MKKEDLIEMTHNSCLFNKDKKIIYSVLWEPDLVEWYLESDFVWVTILSDPEEYWSI